MGCLLTDLNGLVKTGQLIRHQRGRRTTGARPLI